MKVVKRQGRPEPGWALLWLPATFVVFLLGAGIVPRAPSPWSNALLWATYGTLWTSFIVVATRLVRRLRRRAPGSPAAAGSARGQSRSWRWAASFTVYLVAAQLRPLVPGLSYVEVLAAAGLVIVVSELALSALWRRREAARRRREIADLAREF